MKFYETSFEDFLFSKSVLDFHSNLYSLFKPSIGSQLPSQASEKPLNKNYLLNNLPSQASEKPYNLFLSFNNIIICGQPASGKYSQALHIIKPYSPSLLKYHSKITFQNDKFNFSFPISDIHYEVDFSLLGCNSKQNFFELIFHIFEVISMNPIKKGIILCKNFDSIHSELLDSFYSYMQQFNINMPKIEIYYIIITENISFIPNNILNACNVLYIPKPDLSQYVNYLFNDSICSLNQKKENLDKSPCHMFFNLSSQATTNLSSPSLATEKPSNFFQKISSLPLYKTSPNFSALRTEKIKGNENIKELHGLVSLHLSKGTDVKKPKNTFNVVCDNIINEILNYETMSMVKLREAIYDILTYNLNVYECIWYIINDLVENANFHLSSQATANLASPSQATEKPYNFSTLRFEKFIFDSGNASVKNVNKKINLTDKQVVDIIKETHIFFKYYNNNYRPIYHLENIFYHMITVIHNLPSQTTLKIH